MRMDVLDVHDIMGSLGVPLQGVWRDIPSALSRMVSRCLKALMHG